ncbi:MULTISPECIES: iron-hydroxamate ABC transporter substrate-binding protein [Pontibacillus]|uniref:Iron-hydroxamate ABC transporter substrate-binding protein n=1 Tax=Pontibacillus chungwhensis TaxID=265426 RepID=A0ABY8V4U8_9BACI|nr:MULTISPECIES: iron-hydroxamate ABC transporter substrate-binding protein [Pontibacillus]MCD5322317.1 iron-hydroxamate ABC transporter substrate-binding protein [Pontibacillus sp. HN14]WIF99609.1 iron-hydroxamate ABC transporter substrate-binding protein [Pontibacillus chungwhensis]
MKKIQLTLLLMLALVLSACSNSAGGNTEESETNNEEAGSGTFTYQSENGPVEVPKNPERVIVLSSFAGNLINLDVNLVGVDSWSKNNPRFQEELEGVEAVTADNLEKIIEMDPDLIIGLSTTKNIDKLKEIAPTVTYTYGKADYLEQHIEIGKLVNKEEKARDWVEDFEKRAQETGEKIKDKIGEDATVSVIEKFDKQIYVFGDNWGRGTEILYQAMGLKMPEKVKEMALEPGYYAISPEVLPEYAGDYMIFSKNSEQDNSFQETKTYQNIPAVKNDQVFEVDAKAFYFNDPNTLDYQLDYFKEAFLGE